MTVESCRSCGTTGSASPCCRSGRRRSPTRWSTRCSAGRPDPTYPLEIVFCADCTLVQLGYALPADASSARTTRTSRRSPTCSAATPPTHVEQLIATRQLGPRVARRRGRQQRRLPAAQLRRRGVPASGSTRRPGPAAAAEAIGVPTIVDFFGSRPAEAIRRRARSGRRDRRQQRDGPRPRPERLRRRVRRRSSPTTA